VQYCSHCTVVTTLAQWPAPGLKDVDERCLQPISLERENNTMCAFTLQEYAHALMQLMRCGTALPAAQSPGHR
jgi:hypothetical protein